MQQQKAGFDCMWKALVIINAAAVLCLPGQLRAGEANTQKQFEVVSVKRSLDVERVITPGWRYLKYEGNRFSANVAVGDYIAWAFSPVRPDRTEFRDPGILVNYYKIEAVAPMGTTLDDARLMLRKVLADRDVSIDSKTGQPQSSNSCGAKGR